MLPLPDLSSVSGRRVVANFDGGLLSSDGGVLALREVEQRLRIADRLAACVVDSRAPDQVIHSFADIIRFRLMKIGAGYEDGIDANSLRSEPMFKMALDLTPSDRELCSQSTISRLENLPDVRALLRMGRAMVDLYCESFARVLKRITLDIDDTFDAVHGGQQLSLFNAHYDECGFQPIVVFDGEGRFITAMLRSAKRPRGKEIEPFLRRLLRAIRIRWPRCGWGRLLRQMLYFSDPDRLFGVDPWHKSIEECRKSNVLGNISQFDYHPRSLPEGIASIDCTIAFSIFTHLAESNVREILDRVRKATAPGGLFVATIRPVEYWGPRRGVLGEETVARLVAQHEREDYAFIPSGAAANAGSQDYGEASVSMEGMRRLAEATGWKVVGRDWLLLDPFQLLVCLQAAPV